jgi:excisionase family DNA binding protein
MAQEYYSLEEAAQKLGLPADELREMAKKGRDIRAFRDGANWKFRGSDIDEMARKRSLISDPDLGSGDSIHGDDDSILSADDMPALIDEGALSGLGLGSSSRGSGSGSGKKPGSGTGLGSGVKGPGSGSGVKGPGSGVKGPGSDIQLAFDDDVLFNAPGSTKNPSDSDVRLAVDEATGLSGILRAGPKSGGLKGKPGSGGPKSDLEVTTPFGPKTPGGPKTPLSGIKKGDLEATSAMNVDDLDYNFDDSEIGIRLDDSGSSTKPKSGDSKKSNDKSDFHDIKLSDSDEMGLGSSGDIKLADSKELSLSGDSGIGVRKPNDSGINLADADDSSSEFELSVDSTDSLPSFKDSDDELPVAPVKSASAKGKSPVKEDDNASEFELALDEDDSASEIEVESGSEVVALDEEEGEEYDEAESEYDGYDDEPTASAGAVGAASGSAVAAEPAPWPAWMVVPLVFTTIAMCLGGIVVVEVMRNAFTYQDGMPVGGTLASAEWLKSFAGFFGAGK